jgi:putative flippase GtrA
MLILGLVSGLADQFVSLGSLNTLIYEVLVWLQIDTIYYSVRETKG